MEKQEDRSAALVLVVDDEELIRLFAREAFEQAGLEVCEAANGSEALEQFAARRPDIIVLEVMMPVMDGFAACAKRRGSVGGSRVPILIMTGLDDAASIARAYEQGATDFITKPINPTILSHRVRGWNRKNSAPFCLLRAAIMRKAISSAGRCRRRSSPNSYQGRRFPKPASRSCLEVSCWSYAFKRYPYSSVMLMRRLR